MTGFVDFHSHLMPGVDDGARRVEQAIDALAGFAAQGATTCITTPHFDASLTRSPERLHERLDAFDRAWERLSEAATSTGGLPALGRGTEVMLDEPHPDLSDPRLRLASGPFVLCEFPLLKLPHNAEWAVRNLIGDGWRPIIAHPERYRNLDARFTALASLREAGACFQLNAGSLLGQHGDAPERAARQLLALGWIDFIASDHHARGAPATAAAIELLKSSGGETQAHILTSANPERLLRGEPPLAVDPFAPPDQSSWWTRLLRRGGGT